MTEPHIGYSRNQIAHVGLAGHQPRERLRHRRGREVLPTVRPPCGRAEACACSVLTTSGPSRPPSALSGCVGVGAASADPAVCGGPTTPPCAPPLSPQQQCALVAWRTWTPCNWVGVQVPVGTPGSVG